MKKTKRFMGETTYRFELGREDWLSYLMGNDNILDYIEPEDRDTVENNDGKIDITFEVPGGGDWSNMSIDIDEQHPLIVKITVKSFSEE